MTDASEPSHEGSVKYAIPSPAEILMMYAEMVCPLLLGASQEICMSDPTIVVVGASGLSGF